MGFSYCQMGLIVLLGEPWGQIKHQFQGFHLCGLGLNFKGDHLPFPSPTFFFYISVIFLAHEHSGTLPYSSIPLAHYTAQLSLWLLVSSKFVLY